MSDELKYQIQKFRERYEFNYEKYSSYFEEFLHEIQYTFIWFIKDGKISNDEVKYIAGQIFELNKLKFPRKLYD
jgi:hypothetical protein